MGMPFLLAKKHVAAFRMMDTLDRSEPLKTLNRSVDGDQPNTRECFEKLGIHSLGALRKAALSKHAGDLAPRSSDSHAHRL
jgi:hypothetical protein